ncbi:hypothetical protein COU78_03525 [Candidatus Peregrinibacteria bacterium CG10_big_fil_rev_8_21_14_0_10_49_24]|nr:MAG: hypothetical protein COV83_05345 [Candidatus Peregrinibacteria bacterium CG11_big_fil_rev_8_21_14_0_20_49_14]PIR51190.1 MAG: hypothetical protein COU78_03525 [Candidatus Peregrinibacteria bacterium CG10_big_fil_rev_8_21_14_0_10_49_24]PJA67229.1 MAG: hypothetical protein CO157_05680 [Candidatus Peregrinibacteria bacterium CG_4_9_14_3_um_filter_49_12]
MHTETETMIGLLTILALGLIIPEIFKKTAQLPFVTSLIIIGSVFGPYGFDVIESNAIIEFFGFLGFTFLMLMAGLETRINDVKKSITTISILAFVNASIPFATGVVIGRVFGYGWTTSLLLGTIFVSSSVAVIIALIESGTVSKNTKDLMMPAFVMEDLLSMILLASIFQSINPQSTFPLPVYFMILLFSIAMLYLSIPPLAKLFMRKHVITRKTTYEDELRFVMVILIAVLLYFSALGVHPILAAFLVGILLADQVTSEEIFSKIHTLSYGLFVPIFFFVVGMEMDITIFTRFDFKNVLILTVITGLIASKFISGFIAGKIVRLSSEDSTLFGTVSATQLTTTLAAAYAATTAGIFDETLVTAIVTLTITTNIAVPICLRWITAVKGKKTVSVQKILPQLQASDMQ